jgi:NADH-quinone oxidoreductase subunit F
MSMPAADVLAVVKDSSIRGRGGAGFPAGMKWSFMSPPDGGPRYLVVNADESEPGTCKDIPLMMANPHALIEGAAISQYAMGSSHAFIYLRGEVVHVYRRLLRAIEEATAAGYLGANVFGSGVTLQVTAHAGAGAYICGEETALLDSLEGRRGQPRLKPPFPGAAGLYARPTSVNNVETIASVPGILLNGATGSSRWAPRSRPASASSASRGTSPTLASSRRRWASPCASSSTSPAGSARVTS